MLELVFMKFLPLVTPFGINTQNQFLSAETEKSDSLIF